ncbi:glutamate synthase large subunit [Candidatus Saganbacteria bacterium]|nr:glutamate synthase large subunit [Candidatus Saganbacteria bacterium]
MNYTRQPQKQGLYDPQFEHDSCGVGFICDIKGQKSNAIVKNGLEILNNLAHRGAVGADPKTGDGAGILIQLPHEFNAKIFPKITEPGTYGTGIIFLPTDAQEREFCKKIFQAQIERVGQVLLGWRAVPVDNTDIGVTARKSEPIVEQIFIAKGKTSNDPLDFERKLYIIRKSVENAVRSSAIKQKTCFYISTLSGRTICYKGLLMTDQVEKFFVDLKDPSLKSGLALVHSRYSTNTFPTWNLAQPFRYLAHNGEINTLRGNINWMKAREGLLKSDLFGADIEHLKPIIVPGGSDSAALDNAFELLTLSGRTLPEAMMMLVPAAWEQYKRLDKKQRDYYEYHACFMEPWDGPAAVAFTDGENIGAVLDRNGLRPARYLITKGGLVVMASEVGVLPILPSEIAVSGRLEPGRMFFIDTKAGKIIHDKDVKAAIASKSPYGTWLKDNLQELDNLPAEKSEVADKKDLNTALKVFGYTREDLKIIIKPMAEKGEEPTGSMGNDTPLAVLSNNSLPLYNYFKQLFAQVTNPPIDPIREDLVMTLESYIGRGGNILEEDPRHAHKIKIKEPVLFNDDLIKLKNINSAGFKTKTISLLFDAKNEKSFCQRLEAICLEAQKAIAEGFTFILLSDRGFNAQTAALPALLAVGAVHHHLVNNSLRNQLSIIVESAEPREGHHFALLFGYGADCINPYLVYEAINSLIADKLLKLNRKTALKNYRKALNKALLKVLSKMGISTLRSYRGAQIFEALGLADDVIQKSFVGTPSRIGGATLETIALETLRRHKQAYQDEKFGVNILPAGGLYQWRKDGEFHLWNPESIAAIQDAARNNDYSRYQEFANLINDQAKQPTTIRSLLKLKKGEPIPLDQVEPLEAIFKRFVTGAMSFGSISKGAHETLAIVMNRLGGRSNTGEGGEDPARFNPLPNGDSVRSAIKQVASGRFGVTANYLVNADEIQIKIAQGAKPGEGGQLPGHKVSAIIARTRYTTPGVTLISPPPHHDIYSIEDLAQLIFDLKNANPKARISVKLVSEVGVGTVAAGVAKGHADMILISGGDGGTGASPISSIKHAGLPWELGLSETHQTLVLNDLRSRVRLQTDGQMRTGRDVALAAILGAEEFGFCTVALIVMGCVMLRHCHLNNCSLGVATQDEILEKRFRGKADEVINYFQFVGRELREIMASLGVKTIAELVGHTELLEVNEALLPWKARHLDLAKVLYKPNVPASIATHCTIQQDHNIDHVLDRKLIELAKPALDRGQKVAANLEIRNSHRTTGGMLSGAVCAKYGESGLPEETIQLKFKGFAGQSFGAFLAKGITFELEGMSNDYVGKGISGGKIIIYPDARATYAPDENIIIGNTTFYGAISGEAYIRGVAGERFCIRNSGLYAVVEGVGDHGCEYMTGGRVVVLGKTGRNFAAGMSGGIAYVYDPNNRLKDNINLSMVAMETLEKEDAVTVIQMLRSHFTYTKSLKAKSIIDDFAAEGKRFVKIMPREYKRILEHKKVEETAGLAEVSD